MSYTKFEFAFWHPFGPHAGETMEEIIARKRAEIEVNGWTLWSFQFRPMLEDWHRELSAAERNEVFVFCSEGRGASDPASTPIECKSYRFVGEEDMEWRPMPKGVRVPPSLSPRQETCLCIRRPASHMPSRAIPPIRRGVVLPEGRPVVSIEDSEPWRIPHPPGRHDDHAKRQRSTRTEAAISGSHERRHAGVGRISN